MPVSLPSNTATATPMPTNPPIPPVPVPPGPTTPSGGSGGLSSYYGLPDGYTTGQTLQAADLDNLVNLLDNLGAGALAAIGAGTVAGGDSAGTTGLTLSLSAWRGVLPQSATRTGFAPGVTAATALPIPANSTFVVWAVPLAGNYPNAQATPYDTAETGAAQIVVVTDGSAPDGGLPLLSGTSSASAISNLADLRTFSGTAALSTALSALATKEAADQAEAEAALGAAYFPDTGGVPPAAVDARIGALERAAAGAGEVDYWDGTARSGADPQTIPAYVAAQMPPPQPPVTPAPLVVDIQAANLLKTEAQAAINAYNVASLMAGGGSAGVQAGQAAARAYAATLLDTLLIIPGITDPAQIDLADSTPGIVNFNTGVIG